MIWPTLALILFICQIAVVLAVEFRRPAKCVAWLAILFVCPLIGFVFYCLVAREYTRRTRVRRRKERENGAEPPKKLPKGRMRENERDERLIALLSGLPRASVTERNDVEVLSSAEDMFHRMLEDIASARDHIHMIYYIWNDDGWGRSFRDALCRKAREGVAVRVIYDGVGAYATPKAFWDEIRSAGGEVHCFLPMWISLFAQRLNFRNHRKLTIVDGHIAYLGGINIGDEYTGKDPKLGYWRDTAVRIRGEAARELQRTFLADWEFVGGKRPHALADCPGGAGAQGGMRVVTVPDGPDGNRRAVFELMFAACISAKQRIYATTPYLIPERALRCALTAAALSGVDVRIIIPGTADNRLTLWATLSHVEELLNAGVRVYRYQKGFLHAKTLIVDDYVAMTGSANMDLRSLFSNFELQAAFFDQAIVGRFAEDFAQDLVHSEEIAPAAFAARSRRQRILEAAGRVLAPLL